MEESENGFMDTLYSTRGDLACTHLDWLNGLREDLLEISVHNREEFENIPAQEYDGERACLYELPDNARYTGNDWHCPFCIGLTETPAVGQGALYPEDEAYDGLPTDYENLWYFPRLHD